MPSTLRNLKGDRCNRAGRGTELGTLQKLDIDVCYGRHLRHIVMDHNVVSIVWYKWSGLAIVRNVYAAGTTTALAVDQLHFVGARCQGVVPFRTRSLLASHTCKKIISIKV